MIISKSTATTAIRWVARQPRWLFWAYLIVLVFAELLIAMGNFYFGVITHSLLLCLLILHATLGSSLHERKFALTLILVPLVRLLSVFLPLSQFPQLWWYPIVSVPLLCSVWVVKRQLHLNSHDLGLRIGNPILQIIVAVSGFGLGAIEYTFLRPTPLISVFNWSNIWLPALSLLVFTGFTEELIFRGLFQSTARPMLKCWTLLYVSLVFASLHIGNLSLLNVIFVFWVGMLFGFIVQKGKSILGVSMAHGLNNITLFLIMPYLYQLMPVQYLNIAIWIIAGILPISVLGIIFWEVKKKERISSPV